MISNIPELKLYINLQTSLHYISSHALPEKIVFPAKLQELLLSTPPSLVA